MPCAEWARWWAVEKVHAWPRCSSPVWARRSMKGVVIALEEPFYDRSRVVVDADLRMPSGRGIY